VTTDVIDRRGRKIVVTFDSEKGFAPVLERQFGADGALTWEYIREFARGGDGVWHLVKATHLQYGKGPSVPPSFRGVIDVEEFSSNAPVPPELFTPAGFGLPAGTRVVDRVLGDLEFVLGQPADLAQREVERAVTSALATVGGASADQLPSADDHPVSFGPRVAREAVPAAAGSGSGIAVAGAARGAAGWAVGIAAVILGGGAALWARSRSRSKQRRPHA
jgi:hypothetical protein